MRLVLDTHAWIWWVTEDRRLSQPARRAIRKNRLHGICISLISIWEVAKKVEIGKLVLDRPLDAWLDRALEPDGLVTAALTRAILVESCRLPGPSPGDPADQIIVATTRSLGAVLVTKDATLRAYPHVRSLW